MDELRDLYQSVILDHYKKPRNYGEPEGSDRHAQGVNPLCGDRVTVHARLDDAGRLVDVGFEGEGCAISTAAASLMTQAVKGMTVDEIQALFQRYHELVTGEGDSSGEDAVGKLKVLAGVREFPSRIKCATLVWHALRAAISENGQTVTTE